MVFSDAPEREAQWPDRLYKAAGRTRRWRIGDALAVAQPLVRTPPDHEYWRWFRLERPRSHRAASDAIALAQVYAHLRVPRARSGS